MPRNLIPYREITVRRTVQGFELSAMVNGERRHCLYIGMSLREARRDFRKWYSR